MNASLCLFMFATLIFCGKFLAKDETIITFTKKENHSIPAFLKDDYLNGAKSQHES